MKIKNLLLVVVAIFAAVSVSAAPVGSIIKKAAPINVPVTGTGFPAAAVCDFKAVTVDGKLWAQVVGSGYTLAGNAYSTQIRLTNPTGQMHEANRNAPGAIVNVGTLTTTLTAMPFASGNLALPGGGTANFANFNKIAVLQEDNNIFYSTATWDFDQAAANSGLTETEKPVLTTATAGEQSGSTLPITLAATDDSGDFFYYISNEENNYHTILFASGTLTGLTEGITELKVVAMDYAGNSSDPIIVSVGDVTFASVLDGTVGDDVQFVITSTANSFTIYVKPVSETAPLMHFLVQAGVPGTVFEEGSPVANQIVFEQIPGVTGWSSGTVSGLTGNAENIVRLFFTYRINDGFPYASLEDDAGAGYELFYRNLQKTGQLTSGQDIDFKLGDSGTPPTTSMPNVVVDKDEKARQYFTIDGRAVTEPTFGIYIVKKIYVDGSVATEKVLVQ